MRPLTKRDREIKAMILRGMSPTVIAQNKGMTRSALYKVIDKLIFRKELYVIPGTNPRCYVDANPEDSQIPEKETNGPTVEKDGPPPSGFSGISFAEKCPSGDEWWEAHMTSGIKFTVAHEGDFTDPRDRNGFYIGFWKKEEPTKMNGETQSNITGNVSWYLDGESVHNGSEMRFQLPAETSAGEHTMKVVAAITNSTFGAIEDELSFLVTENGPEPIPDEPENNGGNDGNETTVFAVAAGLIIALLVLVAAVRIF